MAHRHLPFLLAALLAAVAAALYLPFLGSALVFDDHNLFTNLRVYDAAAVPFNLSPRTFPYFTLGFTEVTWKSIEAHRLVSLSLHTLNALILFRLLARWLEEIGRLPREQALWLGFAGGVMFAVHPAATYGAGYLVQRTILLATLFSLLALWYYWRGLAQGRLADAASAALFYALAIFSKEHAIMLPAAALLLTVLHEAPWRKNFAGAALFAALCVPSAIVVVLAVKGVIGTPVEPDSAKFISAMSALPVADSAAGQWLLSGVTQAGAFFRYWQMWLLPAPWTLSADIRLDFVAGWSPLRIAAQSISFLAFGALGLILLRRGRRLGLIGFGMLYAWLLFLTEFSSFRLQEPVVLYRSYLWAPGMLLVVVATLAGWRRQVLTATVALAALLLFVAAQDRLRSLGSELALWEDAAAKLPSASAIGADRIFYNRGSQYLRAKRYPEAIGDFSRSIGLNPSVAQSYQQRGWGHYALLDYPGALADFERALAIDDTLGIAHYGRGLALEKLGRLDEAERAYRRGEELGVAIAAMSLRRLAEKTEGQAGK